MRSKKAIQSIMMTLILRIVGIIGGLIVPKLIISTYGSETNGLIVSITQFLGYIILLESGVGGVIRASLYKPLAERNIDMISSILKEAEIFFKKIAFFFLIYLVILFFVFPKLLDGEFKVFYIITLIAIIGMSIFFQYYFGITYQILLHADQRQYFISFLQMITLIINMLIVIILINLDFSIHVVLFASSITHILRPLVLHYYVRSKYKIKNIEKKQTNFLSQKWDGLGHHIAFIVHNNTDVALLTIFSNVREVSVYSIYYLIVSSIQSITVTFSSGLEAAFGNMIAKNESKNLDNNFSLYEMLTFSITSILFSSLSFLILPFISLYTHEITDANYYRPIFAYLLIFSGVFYCIRLPYNSVTLAAGHYKQTKNGAYLEAILNIFISASLVQFYGLIGVAIGTLIAMFFRTVQYVYYASKHILKRNLSLFFKKIVIYSLGNLIILLIINQFPFTIDSYISLSIAALLVLIVSSIIIICISLIFYSDDFENLIKIIKRTLKKETLKND